MDADSAAYHASLRGADQILEYNGIDLRQATAEQAAYELAKPAEKVTLLVQYNPESKLLSHWFLFIWSKSSSIYIDGHGISPPPRLPPCPSMIIYYCAKFPNEK